MLSKEFIALLKETTVPHSGGRQDKNNKRNRRHGLYGTSEYQAWNYIKVKRAKLFGANIEKSWNQPKGFIDFIYDMGFRPSNRHTLERIDETRDFIPSNCEWRIDPRRNRNAIERSLSSVLHTTSRDRTQTQTERGRNSSKSRPGYPAVNQA